MESTPRVEAEDHSPLTVATDERSDRADWVSSIFASALVTVVAGAWLAISTLVLDYERDALPLVCGLAIVVIGLIRVWFAPASSSLALASCAAGVVTVLAGVLSDERAPEQANLVLMGAATAVISLVSLAAAAEAWRGSRA